MFDTRVVWKPLPGAQTLALSCPAQIILFHGTRGPGKTDSQLMRFRRNVGQGYGRHWRGVIFDRQYKNLDDLVSKSMRWFPEFKDGARFLSSKSDYRWVWPTGEELMFRAVSKVSDYWSYHGQEFPWIGWNELTKFPTDELFEVMMSCNRSSFRPIDFPIDEIDKSTGRVIRTLLPEMPLEVFATCNPYGVGHNWVKKRFINPAPMGKVQKKVVNVFNPQTQQREDVVKTQVHIFGSYRENVYLNPEYIAELEEITEKNKRRAWLMGDWDVTSGGMFDDIWDRLHHVVKPFNISPSWKIERSFDWGSSRPFSVGWWARSDGTDYYHNGKWHSTVRGDLFRIHEWYGALKGKTNVGLNMLDAHIAKGIIVREIALGIYNRVTPGPADNSIWDTKNGNSTAAEMAKSVRLDNGKLVKGIEWNRSDKSSGSRKDGWKRCRSYLANALPHDLLTNEPRTREWPGLFVFDTCTDFIEHFPALPRDEEDKDDVDTESEDHIGDETRYYVLDQPLGAVFGSTKGMG